MLVKNVCKDLKRYPQISRRVRDTLARLFTHAYFFKKDLLIITEGIIIALRAHQQYGRYDNLLCEGPLSDVR